MSFSLRRATSADVDDCIDIIVAATQDSELEDFTDPHRNDSPASARKFRESFYPSQRGAIDGEPMSDEGSRGARSVVLVVDFVADLAGGSAPDAAQGKPARVPVNVGTWQFPAGYELTEAEARETLAAPRAPPRTTAGAGRDDSRAARGRTHDRRRRRRQERDLSGAR